MYFWNIEKIKNDMIQAPLSEREQFKYLLATTVLYSLIIIPSAEGNIWDIYSAIVTGLITAFGTHHVYQINGGSEGKYILQRFVSLGWVVGIRWLILVALPLMLVFYIGLEMSPVTILVETTVYDLAFLCVVYSIYFWMLGKHVKEVSVGAESGTREG